MPAMTAVAPCVAARSAAADSAEGMRSALEAFVHSMMQMLGPFGIALLMFLENLFPPIPSELIMPLAGYRSAQGDMHLGVVVAAGSAGALLGALPWYYAGRLLGRARLKRFAGRYGRWLTLNPADIDRTARWFRRRGGTGVLVGRLIPTIRTLISVPAGMARMNLAIFLAFSAVGTVLWTAFLAGAGFYLGQSYEVVADYVDPVSTAVFAACVAVYVYRVITFGNRSDAAAATARQRAE